MTPFKKFAGLMIVALSASLLGAGVSHAAPKSPTKMMGAKPMGSKMGAKKMGASKTMPMRDAKGRFIKKSAAPMMAKAPHKMPMRDAKGRFIKSTPGAMTTPKK